MQQTIGFLGAGRMASAMIERLLSKGYRVQVWNRSSTKVDPLVDLGAVACATPAKAAENADAVISFMTDDDAAHRVWLGVDGKDGALSVMARGCLAIECSTLSHGFVKDLAKTVADAGCLYLDAPVTSVPAQVKAGETIFLIGAEDAALQKARPILEAVGQQIIHFGPAGAGTVYKLMNNLLGAVHIAAAAELVAIAQKAGLDGELVAKTFATGPLASGPARMTIPGMVSGNHNEGIHFTTGLRSKDAGYAMQLAKEYGLPLPVGQAAHDVFETATKQGLGDLAQSAVIETLKA
ncbi:NAD(P)-dependent oxidoreductase [Thalassospira sp. HF15]|uniref:NAD(P)-dependent oxidoreductase n=1 Tax=Thalassospira sp. HF15 TaxID=2722755 RepID=UPI00142F7ABF|nr:NAD(P)-dependent oxidoreductase [Thalassospira sp. HF15]NIY74665.1 NAD(P)-dependent oxidoreductase [Thalassospira sp. HF15]